LTEGAPAVGPIQIGMPTVSPDEQQQSGIGNVTETRDLVVALRNGEERALAELYDRYGGAVYQLALRITRDPGAAQEISVDAFWQVWRQADRYDAHQGTLSGWLFTIARSRAIDRIRAASAVKRTEREEADPADRPGDQPETVTELAERRRLVRRALASLTPAQRTALELAYYEGLSHSEIAARLGEPLGTVKTRIRQAMITMRRHLAPALAVS